ncbi:response regulator [Psychromonas sp. KJ10-10]|uniref:response regulator n=1 Tax=Psychromonas sp. KJ10-10 TaxID=3391823 RepID=UPI0039B4043F
MPISTQNNHPIFIVSDDLLQLKILTALIQEHVDNACVAINHQVINSDVRLKNAQLIIIDQRSLGEHALALCDRIKQQHNHLKIILISGLSHQIILSQAIKLGTADDYLLFPVDNSKLATILKKHHQKSPPTSTNKSNPPSNARSGFLSTLRNNNEPLQPKIKADSMLALLEKRYPGILYGKWQTSDRFK